MSAIGTDRSHGRNNKALIRCAVVEGAGNRFLIIIGAVSVIDRHHNIPFACQILTQMAHQHAVAGVTV